MSDVKQDATGSRDKVDIDVIRWLNRNEFRPVRIDGHQMGIVVDRSVLRETYRRLVNLLIHRGIKAEPKHEENTPGIPTIEETTTPNGQGLLLLDGFKNERFAR